MIKKISVYGAIAKLLRHWILIPEVLSSKLLGGSKVNSVFHPFKVN